MGRNAKPINLHLFEGNKSHLTKAEIKFRLKNEIRLGERKFKVPDVIKNDINAFKKWKESLRIFKDNELVTSADIGCITRYCLSWSALQDLLKLRAKTIKPDLVDLFDGVVVPINKDLLDIESAINKKMDAILKLEDRLFLNAASRSKILSKNDYEKPADPLEERGFGGV